MQIKILIIIKNTQISKITTNHKFHQIIKIKILSMTKIKDTNNLIINKIINKLVIILMKYNNLKQKIVLLHNQLNIIHHKIKEILIRIMIKLERLDKI